MPRPSRPRRQPSSRPSARSTSGSTTRCFRSSRRSRRWTAEEYRRVTEVTYLGYVHGSLSALRRMLPRDRGIIIQVGLGAGVSGHSPPIRLLCGQARDPGVLRLAPVRADPRRQQRPAHDGADAGDEHAAVRLGQEPPAPQGPAGSPDLSARGGRRGRSSGRPSMTAARSTWAGRPSRPSWATRSPRDGSTITWPHTCYDSPDDRRARGSRTARTISGSPFPATTVPHGAFDDRARRWSWQLWADLHR